MEGNNELSKAKKTWRSNSHLR